MDAPIENLLDQLRSVWRFRWVAVIAAFVTAVVSWAVIFALPDKYEANASVFVDARSALKPALQGLTVEQDVGVQLNYVRQALLSGAPLERIAKESGVLGANVIGEQERAAILTDLSESVTLSVRSAGREGDGGGSVYSFIYQAGTRPRALKVIETVLDSFVEETLGGKRKGSENAQKFLEGQIKQYEQRLREAEARLADFKKTNVGLMPSEGGGYFAQLQASIDATKQSESALGVAERRRTELQRQLRGDSVISAAGTPVAAGAAGGNDNLSRVKEAQARLDDLLLRFTDKHPDVMAARATLEELKQRRDLEIESLRRGDSSAVASSGVSANPVYQNIQMQLNQTEVDLATLRSQLAQSREKTAELKQRLDTAPTVEALYQQLNRDYDVNRAQYSNLLANYEKARLGEQADNAGSIRFEIVQPPTALFTPVSPQRTLLLIGAFIVSLGVGGALAFGLHLVRPVVVSVRTLSALVPLPVLGAVMSAFPDQLTQERRKDVRRLIFAGLGLVLAFVIVLLLNWRGLRMPSLPGIGA